MKILVIAGIISAFAGFFFLYFGIMWHLDSLVPSPSGCDHCRVAFEIQQKNSQFNLMMSAILFSISAIIFIINWKLTSSTK